MRMASPQRKHRCSAGTLPLMYMCIYVIVCVSIHVWMCAYICVCPVCNRLLICLFVCFYLSVHAAYESVSVCLAFYTDLSSVSSMYVGLSAMYRAFVADRYTHQRKRQGESAYITHIIPSLYNCYDLIW